MSEKASCPRCDAYLSVIYYDGCHPWCGWNCQIEWTISAYGDGAHATLSVSRKPTPEEIEAVGKLVNAEPRVSISTGYETLEQPWSAWLDPYEESPPELSREGKRQQARAKKRAKLMAEAKAKIDAELGED